MQRLKAQSLTEDEEREVLKAIQDFKSKFVNMNVKKQTEFIFTKTKEGGLKIVYEVWNNPSFLYNLYLTHYLFRGKSGGPWIISGWPKTLLWDTWALFHLQVRQRLRIFPMDSKGWLNKKQMNLFDIHLSLISIVFKNQSEKDKEWLLIQDEHHRHWARQLFAYRKMAIKEQLFARNLRCWCSL